MARRRGPWRGLEDIEFTTLEWVHWYNTQRLLEPIGNVSPVEYEVNSSCPKTQTNSRPACRGRFG